MNQYAVLRVSPDVHREAKIRAAREGLSLKEITERALRDYLWTNRFVDTRETYTTSDTCEHGLLVGLCAVCESRKRTGDPFDYRPTQEENDA